MPNTPLTDIEILRRINARFIHNYVTNDVASHDALLHPDFIYIRSNGQRIGRAAYLKAWATGFDPAVTLVWDTRDERITLVGDTALVRSTNISVDLVDGHETVSMSIYTDVYVRERGEWKCLQAQITPLAAEHRPPDSTIVSVYLRGVRQAIQP